ncbi:MAG: hypothetical protein H0U73_04935 [Tatlockia sp.]|nr:hypothetical protein [Tatlockia sp.]
MKAKITCNEEINKILFAENTREDTAACVRYSMALVSTLLFSFVKSKTVPSKDSPILITSGNYPRFTVYIWTAFMVFGDRTPSMKFGNEAIKMFSTFEPEKELGYLSLFSRQSIYETKFKYYLTDDMLIITEYPRAFEIIPHNTSLTLGEQEDLMLEKINEPKKLAEAKKQEEVRRQEKIKNQEEAKKQEEARKQEEVRKQEEAVKQEKIRRLEHARRQENVRKQEEFCKQEETKWKNQICKLEETCQQEAAIKQEEDKAKRKEEVKLSEESLYTRRREEAEKRLKPTKQEFTYNLYLEVENRAKEMLNSLQISEYNEWLTAVKKHKDAIKKIQIKNADYTKVPQSNYQLISAISNREVIPNLFTVLYHLKNGVDIDYQDALGRTALMHALSMQYENIANYLLNQGADPLLEDSSGIKARDLIFENSPLYELILKKEKDKEKENGETNWYSENPPLPTFVSKIKLPDKSTLLEKAKLEIIRELQEKLIKEIKESPANLQAIRSCLLKGADIDYHDDADYLYTPLMIAVALQNDHVAEYLLMQGANPLVENSYGEIASDLVSRNSSIFVLLKKKEQEVRIETLTTVEKYSLLLQDYVCSSDAKLQKIDDYLALGANIDYQNQDSSTALTLALDAQNYRIAEYLLKNGANPFLKNIHGKTAKNFVSRHEAIFQIIKGYEFIFAVTNSDLFMMRELLTADKTIIDFQGMDGYTALLIACELSDKDIVQFLLEEGADSTLTRDDGQGVDDLIGDEAIRDLFFQGQDIIVSSGCIEAPKGKSSFFSESSEERTSLTVTNINNTI